MYSIKDESGLWFELNKVCYILALSILEVLHSPIKPYLPKSCLMLQKDILYINSLGFLILAAHDRSGRISSFLVRQRILEAFRFWSGSVVK